MVPLAVFAVKSISCLSTLDGVISAVIFRPSVRPPFTLSAEKAGPVAGMIVPGNEYGLACLFAEPHSYLKLLHTKSQLPCYQFPMD